MPENGTDLDFSGMASDRARAIDASGIRRMFELAAGLEDPINLTIGQPDFPVPQAIKDAVVNAVESDAKVDSAHEVALVILTMLFVATLVFILLLSEYWLVNATSSLALSVAGVFKELLTIGGGLFFFSEHLDLLNVIGFILCQVGILMYVKLRYDSKSGDEDEQGINEPYMTVDSSAHDSGFEQGREFRQESSSLTEVSNQSEFSEQMELT